PAGPLIQGGLGGQEREREGGCGAVSLAQRPGFLAVYPSFLKSASTFASIALNSGESSLVTAPQLHVKLVLFFTQAMDLRFVRPQAAHLMSIVLSCRTPIAASLVRAFGLNPRCSHPTTEAC